MAETIGTLKKQYEYNTKYKKENYDKIEFLVPKGDKQRFKEIAEQNGMKVGEWIRTVVYKEINKD